eukprot:TRINITY_DN2863_c0_g2_i1.p1 TRINITY_DN2863_c0_g2~~TRINITY_DN2863_c0_g2_i1.p1  ORF type:complete len:774 (+),score=105.95 TRINITY_DN2863_c0_g2_i1:148-2469(+)
MRRLFFSGRRPRTCEDGVSQSSGNTPLAAQPSSDEAWLSPVSVFGPQRRSSCGAEELSTTASRGRPRCRRQHMSCMQAFTCSGRLPRSASPEEHDSSRDARPTRNVTNVQHDAGLMSAFALVPGAALGATPVTSQPTDRFPLLGSWARRQGSSARRTSRPVADSAVTRAGPAPGARGASCSKPKPLDLSGVRDTSCGKPKPLDLSGIRDTSCGKPKPLELSGIDLKPPSNEEIRQELERLRMCLEDRPLAQCKVQSFMPEKPLSPRCRLLPPAPVVAAPSPDRLPSPEVLRFNRNPMVSRPSLLARNVRAASADVVHERFRLAVEIAESAMMSGGTAISTPSTRASPGPSVSLASSGDTATSWSDFSSSPLYRPNHVGLPGQQRFQEAPQGTMRARAATAEVLGLPSSGVRIQRAQELFSEMLAPGISAGRFTCSSERVWASPALAQQRRRPRTSSGTRNFADMHRASAPALTPLNGSWRSLPTVMQAGKARPSSAGALQLSRRSEGLSYASTLLHTRLPAGTRDNRSCSAGLARSSQASIPEGHAVVPAAPQMGTEDSPTKAATDAAFCQLLAAALAETQQAESSAASDLQPAASTVPLSPMNETKVASPSSRKCLQGGGNAAKELTEGSHIEFPSGAESNSPVAARTPQSKVKHKPSLKTISSPLPLPGCTSCLQSCGEGKRLDRASGSTCLVQTTGSTLLRPQPDRGASFTSNTSLDTADEERERETSRPASPHALKSPKRSRRRRDFGEVMAMRRRLEEACSVTRVDRK